MSSREQPIEIINAMPEYKIVGLLMFPANEGKKQS